MLVWFVMGLNMGTVCGRDLLVPSSEQEQEQAQAQAKSSLLLAQKGQLVDAINALEKNTWKAAISPRFATATAADIRVLLGTRMRGMPGYVEPTGLEVKTTFATPLHAIPESFDARDAWPQCAGIIGHVRDQSSCGSCWAMASTEAMNDRSCIAGGDTKTLLSPEDTLSCCKGLTCNFSMGCDGGQPVGAWHWFQHSGVATGGDYVDRNTSASCKPYPFPSCAHHTTPPDGMVACSTLPMFRTPTCKATCDDAAYPVKYGADKKKAKSTYTVRSVTDIQRELMEKGPATVAMLVYEDFELYAGGVYQHVKGVPLGGHAIKMVGWGVDEATGVPYWTCVNSWNKLWGEDGTFRILRGQNECGIEGEVVAGDV
jgi:cathepsin B